MPLLGILVIGIDIFFAVHCVRSGRSGWLFIILAFPVIGSLVYFISEYLPDLRSGRTINTLSKKLVSKINPDAELKRLRDQAEHNPSVANRIALAEGLVNAGLYKEPVDIYKECLEGIYKDDKSILAGLCRVHLNHGNFEEAEKYLVNFNANSQDRLSRDIRFLYALALEEAGRDEDALEQYATILINSVGEEIRCRYGLLLKKLGREDEATLIFKEILRDARVAPRFYRRNERRWISIARRECNA